MADSTSPTSLPSAGSDGFVHISDDTAAQLVDAGLSFDASDDVVVHADHTTLKTSLSDLQKLGVDHVESDGDEGSALLVNLGIDVTDDNASSELESLLNEFASGTELFDEADHVELDLDALDIDIVDTSIADELRLLGFDDVSGEDDGDNDVTRDLDDV
jgi:hypothetical protein